MNFRNRGYVYVRILLVRLNVVTGIIVDPA